MQSFSQALNIKFDSSFQAPIPKFNVRRNYISERLSSMHVGDSFLVSNSSQLKIVKELSKELGIEICSKKNIQGFRIWRIEDPSKLYFNIVSDIPLDPSLNSKNTSVRKALKLLKIGDSFLYNSKRRDNNLYNLAQSLGISIRVKREGTANNYRVWRVEEKQIEEIKIESDIPSPNVRLKSEYYISLFKALRVGQSFLVNSLALKNCIIKAAKRANVLITIKRQKAQGSYRVWRIDKNSTARIEIQSNIPVPTAQTLKQIIHYLGKIKIGDSFLIDAETQKSQLYLFARFAGIKIKIYRDIPTNKFRLWRVG